MNSCCYVVAKVITSFSCKLSSESSFAGKLTVSIVFIGMSKVSNSTCYASLGCFSFYYDFSYCNMLDLSKVTSLVIIIFFDSEH